ncbi:MAG: hypothetical protein R2854_08145 [Caldilineaceae bacterium]
MGVRPDLRARGLDARCEGRAGEVRDLMPTRDQFPGERQRGVDMAVVRDVVKPDA